ncbi:amino acid adenylation domain-containing protein [Streptomyces sp. NBC_01754]|uniref:non-ribosomal peptide synthetase/type I polyketide synthase n=1 Tax=Streptomyces sp. NBC_01754 TaxID=2975930 RepID=UPI002DD8CC40|nr:non-ribosomal peptide synthetase/type I polyketide synthase [Streptomyces sp. NBC_01754]WSC96258.1 amino acid adenylation domain-containing protein [Streptomyces sp. NBC_01754]
MADAINNPLRSKVAIVGMGCRLPGGASDHRTFWRNLMEGKDCITPTPPDRYDVTTLGSRHRDKPGRLVGGRGGYIDGFDEFDPAFFGISPREADHMDPQQRKLLEVAWEALEDGGQRPADLAGADVAVYVGAFTLDYKILQFADLGFTSLAAHTATGTMMTMVSNRISHCFDFRGPSLSIDTACSSSLVAVHLACQALDRRESDLALAGGTLLHMAPQYTVAETKGGFLSPGGRSRTFDADADGYVRAEGVGLVALKRLEDAVRDGDRIHAVILGSGVNQDGRTNGITVPNPEAQVSLIRRVCAEAGIAPGGLQYMEAHGTSTPVGDPIEANALARALAVGREPGDRCYVGSVKTNIGHTESAAGIAGLIKTVLCLKHRQIPPHINLERLNPAIDAAALPYEIPTRPTAWPGHEGPARAGVNSFGFGGTNAHVVLEEAPAGPAPDAPAATAVTALPLDRSGAPRESATAEGRGWSILPLSARHPEALGEMADRIAGELTGRDGRRAVSLPDLGHTLAHRRQHLPERLSVVYSSRASLDEALTAYGQGEPHPRVVQGHLRAPDERRLVWVFTGMGPQWWGMGRELLRDEPAFREAVTECDRVLREFTDWSLLAEMSAGESASRMSETWLAQPANFALQVGLAALWRSYGVRPDAVVGHSTGEIAAFYEAGVYCLEDAVRIVVHRSRLQQTLAGTGTMLAVNLTEDEAELRVRPYQDRVSIAAVNSPASLTLAGEEAALTLLAEELRAEQLFAKFLTVEVPYHSVGMERIKDELFEALAPLVPRQARVPLYLTGREGTADGRELDAAYWWKNVRDRVRFRAAVDRLADDGHQVFLEIGPHPVLGHSIRECLDAREASGLTLPSIRRKENERERFAASLAALHNLGTPIDWKALQPTGRPVTLPRYPWRRDRHWTEPQPVAQVRLGLLDHPLLGRRTDHTEPTWQARLDTETLPYLADHRIQDTVVFPAAGYLEMAAQAVLRLTGGTHTVLADIDLRKALFLSDTEDRTVQLTLSLENAAFTVASPAGPDGERTVHARGVVRTGQRRDAGPPLDTAAVLARTARRLDGPACYAALAGLGYHYGPAFQAIEEVWIGTRDVLARIRPPQAVGDDAARHHLHPVLLDACFQSLLTPLLLREHPAPGTGIRLPLSVEEAALGPVGDQPLWVHATVLPGDGDTTLGDITLYAEDGAPLGRISGFRAADVEKAATTVARTTIDSWLAETVWPESPSQPDTAEGPAAAARDHGWLLLADGHGVADAFAALASARGERCRLVRRGGGYTAAGTGGDFTVDPGSTADLERLFADLDREGGPFRGAVLHLWNLDRPHLAQCDRQALGDHTGPGSYSLIALARTLLARGTGGSLHIVTRGAQPVLPGEAVEPLGAPAWGIGRVLRHQELAGHPGKLIDLDPLTPPGPDGVRADAEALLREVLSADEEEIALRAGGRRTSRLRPAEGLTRPLPLCLRADGSYLVTGAFGALGRLLCRTLVRRGARRLILVGRTPVPAREKWGTTDPATSEGRAVTLLRELEALGAQTVLAPLDVTDEDALTGWLDAYRRTGPPPLRGVFHLAGQVRDTLVGDLDRSTFDAVHDPKTVGAYLLHRHLRDEPLDHFVLFASIASLLTTAGQTNYAAGNAFLDALAHHRRAQGLPALSLDWGPWATGMIEELGLVDHYLHSRGMSSLAPEAGMGVLERVIGQDHAQLVVATVVDWPVFLAWYPAPPPLVAELAAASAPQASTASGNAFLDVFGAADEITRRSMVAERFAELAAAVLRTGADRVDLTAGLGTLGLDSLLAMELRARIHAELGVALPVVALLSGTPAGELAAQLHDGLTALVSAEDADGTARAVELHHDESRYPLTQNQKALWFLKHLNPDGYAYNIGGAVEVTVALEPELMFEAVRRLIARHPALRTNFVLEDGRAVQRVSQDTEPDLALFDVQGQDWDTVHRTIVAEYRKPYDLAHDPLVRFRLFKRGPERWVIMKAVHHIVSDAISTFTFIEELFEVYEALRQGREPRLPPVTARYLDFLNQQNEFLAGREAAGMLDYWRSHLPAEVPLLDLPVDKPRPAVQTHNGASEFFELDAALSARVHALARAHQVTPFMVLLGAYYLLLHRYSGQDHIIVGSPVTGRTRQDFASVYGYFVNPLPLHADLSDDPTVTELLEQVRRTVLGGLDNQEYPFVLLVEELGLQHDPSRSAVFQAMFILLTHKVATEQYGYRLKYIELPEEEGQFDLTLSVYEDESEHRFHCVFKYNTDLLLPGTVRRMSDHYTRLLEGMTRVPGERVVSRLDMLGHAERERLAGQWSRPALPAGPAPESGDGGEPFVPVHTRISRVAAARPGAVAVTLPAPDGGARRMTYGELERRATGCARRLRALGVTTGSVVALRLDKSPEMIVTLVAVLKAGGAYLPVQPDQPADRLAHLLRTTGAVLVVEDTAGPEPAEAPSVPVVSLDALHAARPGSEALPDPDDPDGEPGRDIRPDSLAYVITTSGSTGHPKAVRVGHGSLASAYNAWRDTYGLERDVRVHLQMAGPSFDVFTGDLVRALCSGGNLVLADRDLLFDTPRLYRTMRQERVDCAEFVPAVVRGLMDHCTREELRLDFMRLLVVGSDAWNVGEYRRLGELCGPATRVVNSYGLTEATVDSAFFEGPVDDLEPGLMVPIGRPLPNSTLHVLDAHGEPVPPGVPGELWVGGQGVALGYAGDPEETGRRFVTRTLSRLPDAAPERLYRTGDTARWDAHGRVHLLGRTDGQVKLRGHRIEIGEIEAHLDRWPPLARAVVTVRTDTGGDTALCAYCVPAPGTTLDRRALRRHLAASLPSYMIPAYIVPVPSLPLTANGKVDLSALPAPHADTQERPHEPPVTLYEVSVARIWQELLGLEQVGLEDDFFEAGGSSIKLIELLHHLRTEFGVAVPVSRLYRTTSLHGMAATVEEVLHGTTADELPFLAFNAGRTPLLFAFPPAGGHGLVYHGLASHLPEYAVIGFNYLPGDDKVARYADLVESAQPEGDCLLLGYSLGGNLAFETAKELECRGRRVSHVVVLDSRRILEPYAPGDEGIRVFEAELAGHLRKHTGSEAVAQETLAHAAEYLTFCGRTPNTGTVAAAVSVITDEEKASLYAAGERGTWHGSSTGTTTVLRGSGTHADMLDPKHLTRNAELVRAVLTGDAAHGG